MNIIHVILISNDCVHKRVCALPFFCRLALFMNIILNALFISFAIVLTTYVYMFFKRTIRAIVLTTFAYTDEKTRFRPVTSFVYMNFFYNN